MDLKKSEEMVSTWVKLNADKLGLSKQQIKASYIWNPGGFVNQSFKIHDDSQSFHLKLTKGDHPESLYSWLKVNDYLANKYNTPRIVKEVDEEVLPGYGYGLVFEYIQGVPLSTLSSTNDIISKVLDVINGLHQDDSIKHELYVKRALSNADTFLDVYIERFNEDLELIESNKGLLPFVENHTFDWFRREVHKLESHIKSNPLFQHEATDVVHNDLNWENILVDSEMDFRIIDWDDLSVSGDAAIDYSTLLWPVYDTKDWSWFASKVERLAGEKVVQRMYYYFRAKLLDEVIDVLADYIEAEDYPQVKEQTQWKAREIHLKAYKAYRKKYK